MKKHIVTTCKAPSAIGPYSQAVIFDRLVYCSGQIGLHPETGEMAGTEVATQAVRVMENLGEVLAASGSGWDNVLKCTIYLTDMKDFSVVNDIYSKYFNDEPPAREAVAVASLPKNAKIEISCMAHL